MSQQIMVVDDDQAMLRLIGLLLEKTGFQVIMATSAFQALEILKQATPDAFILDVMMPDIDGIELCRQIRMGFQAEHSPIIMLSARDDTETVDAAYRAGATGYLSKPISPHELRTALDALL